MSYSSIKNQILLNNNFIDEDFLESPLINSIKLPENLNSIPNHNNIPINLDISKKNSSKIENNNPKRIKSFKVEKINNINNNSSYVNHNQNNIINIVTINVCKDEKPESKKNIHQPKKNDIEINKFQENTQMNNNHPQEIYNFYNKFNSNNNQQKINLLDKKTEENNSNIKFFSECTNYYTNSNDENDSTNINNSNNNLYSTNKNTNFFYDLKNENKDNKGDYFNPFNLDFILEDEEQKNKSLNENPKKDIFYNYMNDPKEEDEFLGFDYHSII